MAKKKKAESVVEDNQSRFTMSINGYTLSGVTIAGFWIWQCPDFPELATKYSGLDDSSAMVGEFTRLALEKSSAVI